MAGFVKIKRDLRCWNWYIVRKGHKQRVHRNRFASKCTNFNVGIVDMTNVVDALVQMRANAHTPWGGWAVAEKLCNANSQSEASLHTHS